MLTQSFQEISSFASDCPVSLMTVSISIMALDGSLQDVQEERFLPALNVSADSRCLPTREHDEVNFEIWEESKRKYTADQESNHNYPSHFFNRQISSLSHSHCPIFCLGLKNQLYQPKDCGFRFATNRLSSSPCSELCPSLKDSGVVTPLISATSQGHWGIR